MRKQLMVGTALAAATMLVAGGALAADKKMMKPSISVNGYYEGVVGGIVDDNQETEHKYSTMGTVTAFTDASGHPMPKMDNKKDTSALDTRTDAEIHFNGRAATDNGMKFHARVELEGANHHSMDGSAGGDVIDEYFLSVSGSFGKIILGGTEGAPVKMLTGFSGSWATGVGENVSFDDAWVPSAAWAKGAGGNFEGLGHSRLSSGDGEKITYISPKLGGFQLGLTYEPRNANNDDNSRVNAEADRHDTYAGAISYSGKFGDVGFGFGAGYMTTQGANEKGKDSYMVTSDGQAGATVELTDLEIKKVPGADKTEDKSGWLVAGRFDFGGGFRVAAAYKNLQEDSPMAGAKSLDSHLIDMGVRYVAGANQFSLAGAYGWMADNDARHTKAIASYARALGPGVKWHANIIWNDSESQTTSRRLAASGDGSAAAADATDYHMQETQTSNSGTAIVTGIKVSF